MRGLLKVAHHTAKFGGHKHCGSEDIKVLVYVISKYHVIEVSCDFMGSSPSREVNILRSLVAIGTLVVQIKWF